jgi:uncharacterized membrane protein YbhN (UPF0104 family)
MALLAVFFDPVEVARSMAGVEWLIAGPAIAGLVLVHLVGAATWRVLARQMTRIDIPRVQAARLYYTGQAFGTITPANVGADAYRAGAIYSRESGLTSAVGPILVQRAGSSAALALLGLAATLTVPVAPLTRVLLAAAVLVAGIAIWLVSARTGIAREDVIGLPASGGARMRRASLTSLAGGLVFHAAAVLLSLALVWSVDGGAPVYSLVAALAIARVTMLLPLTPNGIGFQEAALALLLPSAGVSAEAAIAAAALGRVAMLLTMAVGFGLLLAPRLPRPVEGATPAAGTTSGGG